MAGVGRERLVDPPMAEANAALEAILQLRVSDTVPSLISATTVFRPRREVTLSELAIEAFYLAEEATRKVLNRA